MMLFPTLLSASCHKIREPACSCCEFPYSESYENRFTLGIEPDELKSELGNDLGSKRGVKVQVLNPGLRVARAGEVVTTDFLLDAP